jgi:PAS domain S-box-containing protein
MGKPSYEELESKIRQLETQLKKQSISVSMVTKESGKQRSVLIIDDDDSVRSSLSSYLEDSGFASLTASDGKQGIKIFEPESIDLVLVDLRMPEMDGYDVIKHIHSVSPYTPLIVISGASGIQDAIETMKIGAWDYLVKPIREMSTLVHSIERALKHAQVLTAKHKAEQLLVQSEERYSKLIETTSSGFWQVDKDGITTGVNPALCEMLGVKSEYIIGKNAQDFVYKKSENVLKKILENSLDLKSKNFSVVLKTEKGDKFQALFEVTLAFDSNNQISGAFAFVSDITERNKDYQLTTAIETAGAICHELHQPMQTIYGSVELMLLEMKEKDKGYEFVTIIKESIDRMNKITNQLANITKYKTKKYIDKVIIDLEKSSDSE